MDALSHILDDIHFSHAEYLHVLGSTGVGFFVTAQPQVMFYVLLQGRVHMTVAAPRAGFEQKISTLTQQAPPPAPQNLSLQAGNVVMLPFHTPHHVVFGAPHARGEPIALEPEFSGHRNEPVHLLEGAADTLLLAIRCQVDTEMAAPLFAGLPDFLLIHHDDQETGTAGSRPDWLTLGLDFLALETRLTRPGRDSLINRLIGMFLVECIRDHVEQLSSDSESWLVALRDPQLSHVLSALHQQPAHPWSVAELARIACMSRSAFAARFHTVMRQPPLAYLVQHRLRLAARALRRQQHSVARISEQVGYGSESAFSQAFRRHYGVSPAQYRRQFS